MMAKIVEYAEHFHDIGEYLEDVAGLYAHAIDPGFYPIHIDSNMIAMYEKIADLTSLSKVERDQLIQPLQNRTTPPAALLLELIHRLAGELHLSATSFSDFLITGEKTN